MPSSTRKTDPYRAFNFRIRIPQILVQGGFSEVTGLESEMQVTDYREGGRNSFVHKRAGPVQYPSNLVLKRGMTDIGLMSWFRLSTSTDVKLVRMEVSIELLDHAGVQPELGMVWVFKGAYPVKWTGPQLRADQNSLALETLELAHEGMV